MENTNWMDKCYSFFNHKDCECFPCHKTDNETDFNCLFCYCPLYALGRNCGGNPTYMENGIKNCSNCSFPHKKENYGLIQEKLQLLITLVKDKDGL